MRPLENLLRCQICGGMCKRGVRVLCCGARACRACSTKQVTLKRMCWLPDCRSPLNTEDLNNDVDIRTAAKLFQLSASIPDSLILRLKRREQRLTDLFPRNCNIRFPLQPKNTKSESDERASGDRVSKMTGTSLFATALFPVYTQPILVRLHSAPPGTRAVKFVSSQFEGARSSTWSKVFNYSGQLFTFFFYSPRLSTRDKFLNKHADATHFLSSKSSLGKVREYDTDKKGTRVTADDTVAVTVKLVLLSEQDACMSRKGWFVLPSRRPAVLMVKLVPMHQEYQDTKFGRRDVLIVHSSKIDDVQIVSQLICPARRGNIAKVVVRATSNPSGGQTRVQLGSLLATAELFQQDKNVTSVITAASSQARRMKLFDPARAEENAVRKTDGYNEKMRDFFWSNSKSDWDHSTEKSSRGSRDYQYHRHQFASVNRSRSSKSGKDQWKKSSNHDAWNKVKLHDEDSRSYKRFWRRHV